MDMLRFCILNSLEGLPRGQATALSQGHCHLTQEFATVLQEAAASAGGSLEPVEAPLADFALPPRFCHQHLAVQTTDMIGHVLAA